jgi:hypothetical protein
MPGLATALQPEEYKFRVETKNREVEDRVGRVRQWEERISA